MFGELTLCYRKKSSAFWKFEVKGRSLGSIFCRKFEWGFFHIFPFYVHYSTLLHLPPHRFHSVGWCWDWTQDSCDFSIHSQTLYITTRREPRSNPRWARSHPNSATVDLILTRIDLIHTRLDLMHTRLNLIHTQLDLIHSRLDLIHTWLDLIHTRARSHPYSARSHPL